MVVDTSAILALLFGEPTAPWVVEQLEKAKGHLRMSTVNLAETLILLEDRQPRLFEPLRARLLASGIEFVAPDTQQAATAASARLRLPLNLGDCFAYALAATQGGPLLTLDQDFRATDLEVLLPP